MATPPHLPPAPACRYDGQEAVMTGIEFGATKKDSVITSYRNHCHHITRGGTIAEVIGELFGRSTGASKGGGALLPATAHIPGSLPVQT